MQIIIDYQRITKVSMELIVIVKCVVRQYLQNSTLKTIQIGKTGFKRKQFIAILKDKSNTNYFNHFIEFMQREVNLN